MDNVLSRLTYGLYVLSVHCYKKDNACIINTAVQVASTPDTISISVNKANHTADMLPYVEDITLSVLSQEADFSLITRFGFASGRDQEKFEGLDDVIRLENGTLAVTRGTNAYLTARIRQRIDLGSHILVIAEITDAKLLSDVPSASYAYYHEHIKPKKKTDSASGKTVWRCSVCGYEYSGEEVPEDFVCPICKHGPEAFEKVN